MFNTKVKRFIVLVKQNWKRVFNNKDFEKDDNLKLARDLATLVMDIDIEHRLTVLRGIETQVLKETRLHVYNLKKEQLLILSKLEEYEKIQTD